MTRDTAFHVHRKIETFAFAQDPFCVCTKRCQNATFYELFMFHLLLYFQYFSFGSELARLLLLLQRLLAVPDRAVPCVLSYAGKRIQQVNYGRFFCPIGLLHSQAGRCGTRKRIYLRFRRSLAKTAERPALPRFIPDPVPAFHWPRARAIFIRCELFK